MNTAFNFPMTLEELPLSTFGGGVAVLDSALNKAISPTTGKLTGIDTVVVAGACIRVRF
jgi:hypothetical protein